MIDLPQLAKARKLRRRRIVLRPIAPTAAQAQSLAEILIEAALVWHAAADRILRHYDPPIGDGLVRDAPAGLGAEIEQARQGAERLILSLIPRLREWALRFEAWHRQRWSASVFTATGISLSNLLTPFGVEMTLEAFIERNTSLIRDISEQARGRIGDVVFREYQNRTPIREVAKQINEVVELGRKRAIRVAQDQTQKISAALDTERMKEAGIDQWQWRHSGKLHPREEHLARNGRVYSFDDPPKDMPGDLPFCGCRKLAMIDLD